MRWISIGALALGLLGPLAPRPAAVAHAQTVEIDGCNVLDPGQIGVRELVGDAGTIRGVPVTIHTDGAVDTIQLELAFPSSLLEYVETLPGPLTTGFTNFRGNYVGGRVRIVGLTIGPDIPPATQGTIAIVRFRLLGGGTGAFDLPANLFAGDVRSYDRCDPVHTSAVESTTWGRVRSLYR